MLILFSIIAAISAIGLGIVYTKKQFNQNLSNITTQNNTPNIDTSELSKEVDRIEELQNNLEEIKNNIEDLDIPTPEEVSSYDDSKSSLNKISAFFENHSTANAGAEQFILSLLPVSQIGKSLQSMYEVMPKDIIPSLLGDATGSIHDGVSTLMSHEGLSHFIYGMSNLSKIQMISMRNALEHHNFASAIFTPIKSGAMEATGINDATHGIVESIKDVSADMTSALEATPDFADMVNTTDVDITGHIPVITIAIASIREFQLLNEEKTDYMTSLKNIALDAAGAGVGGVAGAKGGAAIGAFLGGPLGAVVGGFIGAVGGAMGGRHITNKIKMAPLKNAIEDYRLKYSSMKNETDRKSRQTLSDIKDFTEDKRSEFKGSEIVNDIPVTDSDTIVSSIALALYQFVLNEIAELRTGVKKLRSSIWYSNKKYESLVTEYEKQIQVMEQQLPSPELIKQNPKVVVDKLIHLNMPNRKTSTDFQNKVNDCRMELKRMNDKNDSSILMWSYMVNNLYQKTLNDIADFSNKEMEALNALFNDWKQKLNAIENKIEIEKGKLGM